MSTADDSFVSASCGLLRPKWAFVAMSIMCALLGIGAIAAVIATGVLPLLIFLVHGILFGVMAYRYAFTSTRNATIEGGRIRVDATGNLRFNGAILVHRDELAGGFVVPSEDGTLVRLDRKGLAKRSRPIFVRVRDDGEGVLLLRALGFDAGRVAAELKIASGLLSMSVAKQLALMLPAILLFTGCGLLIASASQAIRANMGIGMLTLLLTYTFTIAFAPTSVRIGTDGILTRWLGRQRFIPFSQIVSSVVYDEVIGTKRQHGVRLTLRSRTKRGVAEKVRLPTGQTDIGAGDAKRLGHRIDEAVAARSEGAHHPVDILGRGSRSIAEWVKELRRIGAGATDHRTAAIPIDALLRVVEDSAASALERASAALAALASDNQDKESAARRIRIAAETSASPKLRVALTRLTTIEDDRDLANVLDELNAEEEEQANDEAATTALDKKGRALL